jgi:hypothetical protein
MEPGMPSLIDVDPIGPLCNPCYDRRLPPHFDYLSKVLAAKFGINIVTDNIATFAYAICGEFLTVDVRPTSTT